MEYHEDLFIRHLQEMVRIPTVSHPDPEQMDWSKFDELHRCLERNWPLVHRTFTREVIGRAGLLYHWKCQGTPLREPLMLIAHQDVVPTGDPALWSHPPFSGEIHDGCIWGRGTTDSKCNIQAYLDALELLIADGFKPACDIWLGFGYNEEIMGGPHAAAPLIAAELERRGVKLGLLLDECGGIEEEDGRKTAVIYTCEKGYADFEFRAESEGGHSSLPPRHSTLGQVALAAWMVESNPLPLHLTESVVQQMKASAPFTPGDLGQFFADPEKHAAQLAELCDSDRQLNGMMRTTTAVTMAQGSPQANILPQRSVITANSRILPGESLENLQRHLERLMPQGVQLRLVKGTNPPPVSSVESEGYAVVRQTVEELYPGITMIPSMLLGGTDSRYYSELSPSRSVYRFTGLHHDSRWGGAHKADERIACDILANNVKFYERLIRRYASPQPATKNA
ncbi:MAG: M20/M25/M40 family metallo-hydrolase [Pyramidobacter sp.]|jgi:carboxypeptidase PM20D1